ncbi:ANTAR domain-containing response regulator [Thalassotalea loyana]|nr:ANTAR domain-containing protein [Thalassotalea loyana]
MDIKPSSSTISCCVVYQEAQMLSAIESALDTSQFNIEYRYSLEAFGVDTNFHHAKVLVYMVQSINDEHLNRLSQIALGKHLAVAVFVNEPSDCKPAELAGIGVNGYVEGPIPVNRVPSILESALGRFLVLNKLQKDLDKTKQKLSSVKLVEQAKLSLMRAKQMSENEAYQLIRKTAMDNSQKIEDVAKNILALESVLSGPG